MHRHDPAHDCSHDHDHAAVSTAKMAWAVGLTLAFVAVEATAGAFAHSLALVSDAGHNLADAGALGFSWYALRLARRPAGARMTFGYHRVGIFAAFVNAASLVAIAAGIGYEGVVRLRHPAPAAGWAMVAVAAVAVALNFTIGSWLHAGSHHDLNVRSARLHMLGDAISAVGVVVAGLFIAVTGWTVADPVISLLIAGLILVGSWGVLAESVGVLLEAAPADLDVAAVERDVAAVAGVRGVHDLHVWTVGPGVIAASLHVRLDCVTMREGQVVVAAVSADLRRRHRINHATVQIEADDGTGCCGPTTGTFCQVEPHAVHVGHRH